MRLMMGNKSLYAIRMTILVMLFQLLSPAASALIAESQKNGKFAVVCTIQGYQQVWIEANNPQKHSNTLNCPICLLALSSLDVISPDTGRAINRVDEGVIYTSAIQKNTQLSNLSQSFAIRAPPLFS
ncbi:hypothetical protein [Candidatus Thioglobus autotrophicus]|uniref:hypothetical protein n=1 Tax=Candidatus Thioglobus autotrophicus TaxID=1705394 RepID=UPI00299E0291|nr:hypothetical protein [Candidatus Thioglobus autotrophicus]WPE16923.1 hypothetical protein R5P06_02385 [Candidatus Thioglobus autotrophicus]WPE18476.1 hypothetical protein R5P05_02425 [Candidatus Thioglobus autotrophicus]